MLKEQIGKETISEKNNFEDSKIMTKDEYDMISNWISPNKKIKINLLYRASRDGDKPKDFHDKCDNKGRTFCIFDLENGYKIGAYTSVSWKNNGEGPIKDPNAFICSITNKEKYELKNKGNYAIYHCNDLGPNFFDGGSGYSDVAIRDNCLNVNDGIQVCTNAYSSSMKNLIGKESKKYLLLKLKDYEVYQVI